MTDAGWLFRAAWPILDEERPISALVAEASGQIDAIAAEQGARIAGPVAWSVDGLRLIGEALAVVMAAPEGGTSRWGSVSRYADQIAQLAAQGCTDQQIASLLGAQRSTIAKVRHRRHICPGSDRRSVEAVA